ncbi:MAG: hypothetical protein R2780_05930 [Crocinitomicaceae bacterium]|nr:hypothetical protein [Crocinitomicaceae bacterium]
MDIYDFLRYDAYFVSALYFFYFSWVATKYNNIYGKIQNIKKILLHKSAIPEKIAEKVKELEIKAKKYKKLSYIVYASFLVVHLLILFIYWGAHEDTLIHSLSVYAVFMALLLILFWLKGASVIPPIDTDDGNSDLI